MMLRHLLFLLFLSPLLLAEEITVDLNNPTFKEGVLATHEGGVLEGEGIRIQARSILYEKGEGVHSIVAEGDLMVEYGCDILVGRRLEYDFLTGKGCLYEGRIETGPWYVGAAHVQLLPGGCYLADNAFLTTCEGKSPEWGFYARALRVKQSGEVSATGVQGRLGQIPFLWLPTFTFNVNSFIDSPLQYKVEYAGRLGTRVGIRYRFFNYKDLTAFARLEYFGRGPAGGIETEWCPHHRNGSASTQSYVGYDRSINDPKARTRYRFAGNYQEAYSNGSWSRLYYDALSDREMASDYRLGDFNLHTPRTSQFDVGKTTSYWVAHARARPRFNDFQTVSQELPNVEMAMHPFVGPCGIVGMTRASAGYWDTEFAKETPMARGFRSARFMASQTLARPFCSPLVNVLPEARFLGIYYGEGGNTLGTDPTRERLGPQWLGWIRGDLEVNTHLSRPYGCFKHTVKPYVHYTSAIQPTSRNDSHPMFTARDGYADLHTLRFGLRQELYYKEKSGCLYQPLAFDLFTYAFLDTPTIVGQIPRLYSRITYYPIRSLEAIIEGAWNLVHNQIDHINTHFEWTASEWLAFNVEFRYRSPYDWRKADRFNFTLDTYTPEGLLLTSNLSDQRYTVLTHSFVRLHPLLGIELESRHGFRVTPQGTPPTHRAYNEAKISLHARLPCRWQLSAYFEWTEACPRYGINISLGDAKRPPTLGRRSGVW